MKPYHRWFSLRLIRYSSRKRAITSVLLPRDLGERLIASRFSGWRLIGQWFLGWRDLGA